MKSKKNTVWYPALIPLCFTILFVIHRTSISILLFNELHRTDTDEWLITSLAYDMIHGLVPLKAFISPVTWFRYQMIPFEGGTLVDSILYLPFAVLCDISIFSLRTIPLLYSIATFILWSIFILNFFHRRIFYLFSLLYIFAAPSFIQWSLLAYHPYHAGTAFYTILLFLLILLRFGKEKKIYSLAAGFTAGLAVYYSYNLAVSAASVCLLFFLYKKKIPGLDKKEIFLFIISFLIGFSPWCIKNLYLTPGQGLYWLDNVSFLQKFPGLFSLPSLAGRLQQSLLTQPEFSPLFTYPAAFGSQHIVSILTMLYRIVFLTGLSFLIYRSFYFKKISETLLVLYTLCFYFIHALSDLEIIVKYWAPFYPFAYAIISIFLGGRLKIQYLLASTLYTMLRFTVVGCLLLTGISDTVQIFKHAHHPKMFSLFKGHEYYLAGIGAVSEENIEDINFFLEKNYIIDSNRMVRPGPVLEGFKTIFNIHIGASYDFTRSSFESLTVDQINNAIQIFQTKNPSAADWENFLKGLGWGIGIQYKWDTADLYRIGKELKLSPGDQTVMRRGYESGFLQSKNNRNVP